MGEPALWWPRVAECTAALPPLSGVACDVADLLDDPEVGPEQLDAVLRMDPILTLKLLSAANQQEIGPRTVEAAINQLGMKRSLRIVSEALAAEPRSLPIVGHESNEDYWAHGVSTAVIAESLAGRTGTIPPPQAFLAALLHDIGSLAMGLCQELGEPVEGTQNEVGASYLEALAIPSPFPDVCRYLDDPSSAPIHTQAIVQIVASAREIASVVDHAGSDGIGAVSISAVVDEAHLQVIVDEARLLLAAIRVA